MELEFDKEIDAILRRARSAEAVDPTAKGSHLDADTVNAFVENALPERARANYTAHFADCARCRKLLSSSITLNTAAVSAAGIAAESVRDTPAINAAVPWYSKLFRTPSLALGMGALVIVFSGVLGYMFLKDRGAAAPTISQLKPPAYESSTTANASNSNASSAATASANSSANAAVSNSAVPEPLAENERGPGGPSTGTGSGSASANTRESDGIASNNGGGSAAQPMVSAPPPPVSTDAPKPTDTMRKADVAAAMRTGDDKDKEDEKKSARTEDTRRDLPMTASKVGPSRAGPVQNQSNNVGQTMGEMAVTRNAGGKTFNNRNGAWYDSAYHGQATTNIRRGSDEFKKLDAGLRSIANQIGGVVIVVWSGKAYRIQ
ncbi:MAG: hypothetical protein JO053_15350 [Acidobacteria bacterium]|nr:hypothetical protein [Acidobacteriota bacterium]